MLRIWMSVTNQNRMANSVDPDETAHYEPSHQDLHCLHRFLVWSAGLKSEANLHDMLNLRKNISLSFAKLPQKVVKINNL